MPRLQRGPSYLVQTPEVSAIRELSRADLTHLAVRREANAVQTLRDNHHRIARAIASGLSNIEVAATCGISLARIVTLKADPAFGELLAHYRSVVTAEWAQEDTVIEYLRTNALKAQAMIADKLEAAAENNEFLPTRDLVAISELGFDRTGYGKVNKNINVNADWAALLEAARRKTQTLKEVREIGVATPQSGPADASSPTAVEQQAPPFLRRRV